jgi:Domain of unknown function (DUF6484)
MVLKNEWIQEAVAEARDPRRTADGLDSSLLEFGGALIGALVGVAGDGSALIDLNGHPTLRRLRARSCVRLAPSDVGKEAVLLCEGGDPARPIVVGLLQRADTGKDGEIARAGADRELEVGGRRIELTAKDTITLRCGDASITLNKDGKIVIRGRHVISHAAEVNRIRGGSVQLN